MAAAGGGCQVIEHDSPHTHSGNHGQESDPYQRHVLVIAATAWIVCTSTSIYAEMFQLPKALILGSTQGIVRFL